MGLFSGHAKNIEYNSLEEFFEAVGYLATPNRIDSIEAQVPKHKENLFKKELPGQNFYPITEGETTSGDRMKYSIQLRIYLKSTRNAPEVIRNSIVKGNRINRGLFIELLLKEFGFSVGQNQNSKSIRQKVASKFPNYINDFDRGYHL